MKRHEAKDYSYLRYTPSSGVELQSLYEAEGRRRGDQSRRFIFRRTQETRRVQPEPSEDTSKGDRSQNWRLLPRNRNLLESDRANDLSKIQDRQQYYPRLEAELQHYRTSSVQFPRRGKNSPRKEPLLLKNSSRKERELRFSYQLREGFRVPREGWRREPARFTMGVQRYNPRAYFL